MPYDYAPRLAVRARARRRRDTLLLVLMLTLPAISLSTVPREESNPMRVAVASPGFSWSSAPAL